MSNISSRAPRIISFFAVSYIMFGSSDSFYYNAAYILLLCLVWLHGFRTRYVQEESRRRLVRERLEFKRIFSSPSGKKIFGEQQEQMVETDETVIATALAIIEANADCESDSSLSTNDDDDSLITANSLSSEPPICSVHTIDQTELVGRTETGSIASQECCSICLETYAVGDSIARVKKIGSRRRCNHWFHEECILAWLQHHNECPLCRRDMINNHQKEPMSTTAINYGTLSRTRAVAVV